MMDTTAETIAPFRYPHYYYYSPSLFLFASPHALPYKWYFHFEASTTNAYCIEYRITNGENDLNR